jgi:aspartate aminotransferase-like enzyme
MTPKRLLLTPGPVAVHEGAARAMAAPILHHRGPEFAEIFAEVREGLRWLFQTQAPVLTLAASGSGAMEACVVNFFSPGDEAIVVNGGKFGERWVELCQTYGVKVHEVTVPWGQAVDPAAVESALAGAPRARAVLLQASETSTGVAHPVREVAALCRARGLLAIVDAITALGVSDVQTDAWGLDLVVAGSQKGLMLPPGLAFVSVSERAWKAAEAARAPRYYFDLARERKAQEKNQTAFTPAVSLLVGLREVLRDLKAEGLPGIFARHQRYGDAVRGAARALGLSLYAPSAPSNACTAILSPAGIDGQAVVRHLRERYAVSIAGGQGEAKGKIFRISHMGYLGAADLLAGIASLEMTLRDLGYDAPRGAGVRAAEDALGPA